MLENPNDTHYDHFSSHQRRHSISSLNSSLSTAIPNPANYMMKDPTSKSGKSGDGRPSFLFSLISDGVDPLGDEGRRINFLQAEKYRILREAELESKSYRLLEDTDLGEFLLPSGKGKRRNTSNTGKESEAPFYINFEKTHSFDVTSSTNLISHVLFHAFQDQMVVCDGVQGISVWSIDSGKKVVGFDNAPSHSSRITSLSWANESSVDRSLLIVATDDGNVRIWKNVLQCERAPFNDFPFSHSDFDVDEEEELVSRFSWRRKTEGGGDGEDRNHRPHSNSFSGGNTSQTPNSNPNLPPAADSSPARRRFGTGDIVDPKDNSFFQSSTRSGSFDHQDGSGDFQDDFYSPDPAVITAFSALPGLTPGQRGSGHIMKWDQENGLLACGGVSSVIRLWDLNSELCSSTLPTGADSCITCIENYSGFLPSSHEENVQTIPPPQELQKVWISGMGDGTIGIYDTRFGFFLTCT